jgi:uncharacterized membrane protein YphA (DoxX/SURF4 family)
MPSNKAYTFGRVSLFIIYFWFGLLKLLGQSPATPLVLALFEKTPVISSLPFNVFYVLFAIFEILIGILFLFPKLTKYTTWLFILHMITTTMPLILVPSMVWQAPLSPTLEGQYIIKNLALMSIVWFLSFSHKESPKEV